MYTIDNYMVAYKPGEPENVRVGSWPDRTGWSRGLSSWGCCYLAYRKLTLDQKVAQLFSDFHTMVVRDGIDPQAAHREFLKVDEYRRRIAPDIEGAVSR